MNDTLAKAIAYGGLGVGTMFPVKSMYNSGQENRGFISSTLHVAGATAVGGAIGFGADAISGGIASNSVKNVAAKIAKSL